MPTDPIETRIAEIESFIGSRAICQDKEYHWLIAQLRAAREALKPFADFVEHFNALRPAAEQVALAAKPGSGGAITDKVITLGDCRRAAAVLSGSATGEATDTASSLPKRT